MVAGLWLASPGAAKTRCYFLGSGRGPGSQLSCPSRQRLAEPPAEDPPRRPGPDARTQTLRLNIVSLRDGWAVRGRRPRHGCRHPCSSPSACSDVSPSPSGHRTLRSLAPPPSPGHKAVQSVSSKYLLCASASKSSETSPLSPVLGQSTSVSAQFLLRARHGAIGCTEVRAPLVPVRPQSCRSPREVVWMGPKGGGWGRLPESQMSRSLDGWRRGAGVPDQGAVCAA